MKRKRCRICGKGLCIYNKTGECYHHNDTFIDDHAPVTLCTSFSASGYKLVQMARAGKAKGRL